MLTATIQQQPKDPAPYTFTGSPAPVCLDVTPGNHPPDSQPRAQGNASFPSPLHLLHLWWGGAGRGMAVAPRRLAVRQVLAAIESWRRRDGDDPGTRRVPLHLPGDLDCPERRVRRPLCRVPSAVLARGLPSDGPAGARRCRRRHVNDLVSQGEAVPNHSHTQLLGKFNPRVGDGLHRRLAIEATEEHLSLNQCVIRRLSKTF